MTKVCEDFKDRKGCGQPIKLIKTDKGKTEACEPHQIMVFGRDGVGQYMFVPHWIVCSEQRNSYLDWQEKKNEEQQRYQASKEANGGGDNFRNGNSNGGSRGNGYSNRKPGGGNFRRP